LQIDHLKAFSLVKNARKQHGLPRIHGWVYSIHSGQINVVVDGRES
jgi:carbonic anhydrase